MLPGKYVFEGFREGEGQNHGTIVEKPSEFTLQTRERKEGRKENKSLLVIEGKTLSRLKLEMLTIRTLYNSALCFFVSTSFFCLGCFANSVDIRYNECNNREQEDF